MTNQLPASFLSSLLPGGIPVLPVPATLCSVRVVRATKADAAFLWQLYRRCRDAEMQKAGLPHLPEPLLRIQFAAREHSLTARYPGAKRSVVHWSDGGADAQPVGTLLIHQTPNGTGTIRVVDIAVMPQFQGRGIGTALLRGLQATAQAQSVPLVLSVAADNIGAWRLYSRLGFRADSNIPEGIGMNLKMAWPASVSGRSSFQERL